MSIAKEILPDHLSEITHKVLALHFYDTVIYS